VEHASVSWGSSKRRVQVSKASAFEKRSIHVAEAFLQTALILDDQAYPEEEQEGIAAALKAPQPYSASEFDVEGVAAAAIASATHGNNPIPTRDIVRAFAEIGIVCAVVDPEEDADEWSSLQPDITILDWYIRDETGKRARQLLADLIRKEQASYPYQIRLVLVYTTDQDLLGIREKLAELLEGFEGASPVEFGHTGLSWEGWHFVVLAKPGTPVPANLSPLVVEYAELPQRVVREFSRIVSGLLPNVAIAGLSAIRRNTHRILKRFSSTLDPPYLTHRALLSNPADSEEQLVSLLGSEFTAVLEDEKVSEISGSDAAREWIKARDLGFPLEVAFEEHKLEFQDRRSLGVLLSKGVYRNSQLKSLESDKSAQEHLVKKLRTMLTSLLGGTSKIDDAAFAELTILRPHYGSVAPRLSLGTVVLDRESEAHWLCVQPRCDSVRLTKPCPFLFLPLMKGGEFDICLARGEKEPLKLRRERKPHRLKSYSFSPDASGVVSSRESSGSYEFVTTGCKIFRFEGQLRDDIAQDVAHKIASRLSRVGVNRSEWQRLSLPLYLRDQ
jgi:hypothetical protein